MKLIRRKVRTQQYYSVGYDEERGGYFIGIVIPWVVWYNRYYSISKDEYDWFDADIDKLDLLAEECYRAGPYGERFVYSDRSDENEQAR